jgi:hypothetical protein
MTRVASTCRSVAVPSWGLESMTQDVRKREPSGSSMAVRGHGEARYSSMAGLPTGWSCRRVTTLLAGPSPRARGRTEAARRCDFGIAVEQRRARIGPRAAGGRCRVTNLQQRGDQGSDPSPRRMLGGIDLVSNISLSIGDYQRLSAVGIPPLALAVRLVVLQPSRLLPGRGRPVDPHSRQVAAVFASGESTVPTIKDPSALGTPRASCSGGFSRWAHCSCRPPLSRAGSRFPRPTTHDPRHRWPRSD